MHARLRISRVNPIGAGDAFAAGYIKGLLDGRDVESTLRLAMAAAASDAGTLRPGCIKPEELESLSAGTEYTVVI